jgi:hypothetical protein
MGRHTHYQPEREQKAFWPRRSSEPTNVDEDERLVLYKLDGIVDVPGLYTPSKVAWQPVWNQ